MQINLTWDLFVIVFFIITIAYSYIIGANKTLKLILGSYIAILVSDGIGNLIIKFTLTTAPIIGLKGLNYGDSSIIIIKIALFLLWMVLLGTINNFSAKMPEGIGGVKKIFATFIFASMNAAILIATILVFVAGGSFLSEQGVKVMTLSLSNIYHNSYIVQSIILNYNLIFVAPAVTFVALSLKGSGGEETLGLETAEEE